MSGGGIGQGTPPGTRWLQQARAQRRDNPEDMFTSQQNFDRNKAWAKPGPYSTTLRPSQEQQFQQWLKDNKIDLSQHEPAYDMRGFWAAQQAGDPNAKSGINPNDKQIHYPDRWKTPYAATFSNESIYAQPSAPRWQHQGGNYWNYVTPEGHVIFDDQAGRWYGLPDAAPKR